MTTPAATPHLLADYSEQARTQALIRFQLLRPHLEDGVALSAEEFERAWAEGRAMSLEEAIGYALEPTIGVAS